MSRKTCELCLCVCRGNILYKCIETYVTNTLINVYVAGIDTYIHDLFCIIAAESVEFHDRFLVLVPLHFS